MPALSYLYAGVVQLWMDSTQRESEKTALIFLQYSPNKNTFLFNKSESPYTLFYLLGLLVRIIEILENTDIQYVVIIVWVKYGCYYSFEAFL
jgi:hypothetical protein